MSALLPPSSVRPPCAPARWRRPRQSGDRRAPAHYLAPVSAGDQPRQCREPQTVARLVADAADLVAQDCVLLLQDRELGILGHLTPCQHHEAAEQAAYKQVDRREHHSGMISPRKTPPATTPDRVIEPQATADAGHRCSSRPRQTSGTPQAIGVPGVSAVSMMYLFCRHEHAFPRRWPGDAGDGDYRKQRLSQSSASWAISCQPWSIVRECPRSANSRKSVIAGDLW